MALTTAAAIIGAGALGAGSAIATSRSASSSNKDAIKAQTQAADQSAQIQREQLDYIKGINAPYQEAGVNALARLQGDPNDILNQDPGYQFRVDQGNQALESNLLARGMGMSGAQIKAGQEYSQGMASQEYGNAFNRLYSLAGLGAGANSNAASGTANASSGISNSFLSAGDATANGAINSANINNNMLGNITGIASGTMGNLAWANSVKTPSYLGQSNTASTQLAGGGSIYNPGATVTYR